MGLTISLTLSAAIATNSINRRVDLFETAEGTAEVSGPRRTSIRHDHRGQRNDHPAPRRAVRTGLFGGNPPGSLPRRLYQAGTAIARVGGPHSHPAPDDPRDLLTRSPGYPHWAANRGINAIVTDEERAHVVRIDGRWKRPHSTAVSSLRATPLVAARPVTGYLERG